MGKVQKVYTKEFKQEAVRLVETSGKSITETSALFLKSGNKRAVADGEETWEAVPRPKAWHAR